MKAISEIFSISGRQFQMFKTTGLFRLWFITETTLIFFWNLTLHEAKKKWQQKICSAISAPCSVVGEYSKRHKTVSTQIPWKQWHFPCQTCCRFVIHRMWDNMKHHSMEIISIECRKCDWFERICVYTVLCLVMYSPTVH